jgi:hypothetical protein
MYIACITHVPTYHIELSHNNTPLLIELEVTTECKNKYNLDPILTTYNLLN